MTTPNFYALLPPHVIDPTYAPEFLFSPVTADLNGDGNLDLIVLGASYPINGNTTPIPQPGRVYFGDGKGGFTEAPSNIFPTDTLLTVHPRKVLIADFNGDGRPDIFISSHGWDTSPFPGEQNRLYLSQPNGSWIDATASLPQLNDFSHTAAVGDINGDGSIDIFVGNGYAGQNQILSYVLLNNGSGQFNQTRADIPVASSSILDFNTAHHFPGATLADLDGDGRPDLIITADASASFDKNLQTTILWNTAGNFSQTNQTLLPATEAFPTHIDLDAEPIDINGDGLKDLVIVGTQGQPFYDGWFVQILINHGNHVFTDATSQFLSPQDAMGGQVGVATGTPWPIWVTVLDFNHDGLPDFSVEYNGAALTQSTPLIWINDGAGHFHTLKVSDFVAPGNEWQLGHGHLTQTDHGYSFITPQDYSGSGGLIITGLLATTPYNVSSVTTIPAVAVEASMYGVTGTSAEVTLLATNFLPAQVANAINNGLNPQVYACEALGLVFAFGNETNSTAFSNNFGPSNAAMPNTTAGDAAFAAAASNAIFGSASTTNLVNVMQGYVSNWETFYTAHGVPGLSNPNAAQIDLAARGASWGDMVGVALANNLGPLNGQAINFLDDAAQGTAIYGAPLVGQPIHHPFFS